MRLLRPELIFCAVCLVGCARPTLDEEGDGGVASETPADAGPQPVTEADAQVATPKVDSGTGVITAPPRDASTPAVVVDTGVPADDGGDKLPPVLANCDSTGIKSSVPIGQATIGSVSINGTAGTMANVKIGESVDIGITVTFESCGTVYSAQSLFLGVNDGSPNAECKFTGGCSDMNPLTGVGIPLQFTVTAPSTPGPYLVMAGLKATVCIGGTGSASIADTPVAALCVTN